MQFSGILALAVLLVMGGCGVKTEKVFSEPAASENVLSEGIVSQSGIPEEVQTLKDLQYFPQNASAYAQGIDDKTTLLERQQRFETYWFAPWNYDSPPQSLKEIQWPFESYRADDAYGANLQPLPQEWFDAMYEASSFSAYGTVNKYAVALRFSHLRNFPTHKPLFKNPTKAGEGFPFDYLQNSGVHANEPLFVSHYSKEKDWVYVFSSYATGWLPSHAIAYIPEKYTRKWQKAKQLFIIKERVPVLNEKGQTLFEGRVGMMMPIIAEEQTRYKVLAVTGGANNGAWYTKAYIDKSAVAEKPLFLDRNTLPAIAKEMLKSRYGWGGLYEERDCSSTLRDLYAPFGIWLPRNSYQQSKVGRIISFEGLNEAQKVERIKAEGVPFETLLYRKGHILLYLGTYEGEIMVLHNMWGVKTTNGIESARKIVGKAVISTLNIGSELSTYDEEEALLKKLERMNIITHETVQ